MVVSSVSPAKAEGRGAREHLRGLCLRHIVQQQVAMECIEVAGSGVLARGPASG